MSKIYSKKPEMTKGYIIFLIFLYRYIAFGEKQRFDDGKHICLNQKRIAEFLNKSVDTIQIYFKKAINEDQLLSIEGKCIFSKKQKFESNIYGFDLLAMKRYLNSKGINPVSDMREAKTQYYAFVKSLYLKHKRRTQEERDKAEKRKLARKQHRVKKLLSCYTHSYYNNLFKEYNSRLEDMGLGDYKDSFLDKLNFRASNDFCYTRNPMKHGDRSERVAELKKVGIIPEDEYYECEVRRDDINKPENLHSGKYLEDVYEKDTNGSIYRLTYNLSHEKQLSQDIDIYELFWEAAGFNRPYNKDVKNRGLKKACMPIYMKEQGISESCKAFYNEKKIRERNEGRRLVLIEGCDTSKADERYEAYEFLTSYTGLNLNEILRRLCSSMHEVLGVEKFFGRDIFLFESELHVDMKLQLLNRGIFVLNAYDGFFGKPDELTEELFFEVYYKATENLKRIRKIESIRKITKEA